jgi:putative FmdB family regulatory protein
MTYEYKCEQCEKVIEREEPMEGKHPDFIDCPFCGKKSYRIFGATLSFPFYMKPEESPFDYNKRQKTVF